MLSATASRASWLSARSRPSACLRTATVRWNSGSSSKPPDDGTPPKPATDGAAIQDPPVPDALPWLSRPLGVREPPRSQSHSWSWAQQKEEYMDQDRRLADRRHIIKEASKGYFHDLNATRRHGGKTWIAPKVLIREDKALYFPDIEGTGLDEGKKVHTTDMCRGKISVVSFLNTRMSELHAKGFLGSLNEKYLSHPSYQYVQINLQENTLRSMLVSLFMRGIRANVPAALHKTYMLSSQNMEYLREPLGMENKYIGYTYLVDDALRIRWAACGDAKSEETAGLERCVRMLLTRAEQRAGLPASSPLQSGS